MPGSGWLDDPQELRRQLLHGDCRWVFTGLAIGAAAALAGLALEPTTRQVGADLLRWTPVRRIGGMGAWIVTGLATAVFNGLAAVNWRHNGSDEWAARASRRERRRG